MCVWDGATRGCKGAGTHRDECKRAARVDRDAARVVEPGVGADAVEEASSAAAGERGDAIGGEVETADSVVEAVLRCITLGNTLSDRWRVMCGGRHHLRRTRCSPACAGVCAG